MAIMMEKIKEFLISIGLGKNEAEIYAVLVASGASSVLEISKKTAVHRSNIYDSLRKLMHRGLIYEIEDVDNRLFSAKPISALNEYLKQKNAELQEISKDFEIKVRPGGEGKIKVSKGQFALRESLMNMLKPRKEILIYGIPKEAPENMGAMLKDFHKTRIKLKITMKHIYNSDALERVKYLNSLPFTEARILPSKYNSSATTAICGDEIVIWLWDKEVKVILISDVHMSKPYKNYFDVLWGKAKVV